MCLILFAIDAHPDYPLVIASNRDEAHQRPTAPLGPWPDHPDLLAGRDLVAGGTWLGIHRSGRWAAVTNVRQGLIAPPRPRSRGHLVRDYLLGNHDPTAFAEQISAAAADFGGFNLLLGEPGGCIYLSNESGDRPLPRRLGPGLYGLANGNLDSDWPKMREGRDALRRCLHAGIAPEALLALLRDERTPDDAELPDTGIGLDKERLLARRFIAAADYGTRASTAIIATRDNRLLAVEQNYGPLGVAGERISLTRDWRAARPNRDIPMQEP